ncbi:MAG: DUF4363 family protein [Firmicutes bacterium]|nr:DUF4363 family protein [Bacillota bacterium]
MRRLVIVIVLAAILVAAAIVEQRAIMGAYDRLGRDNEALISTIRGQEKVDTPENIKLINHMYDYWQRNERRLSMITRHFDLAQVSTNIIYAKNFIEFDNKEEAMVGLLQTRYLIRVHTFNAGTHIQNVI